MTYQELKNKYASLRSIVLPYVDKTIFGVHFKEGSPANIKNLYDDYLRTCKVLKVAEGWQQNDYDFDELSKYARLDYKII